MPGSGWPRLKHPARSAPAANVPLRRLAYAWGLGDNCRGPRSRSQHADVMARECLSPWSSHTRHASTARRRPVRWLGPSRRTRMLAIMALPLVARKAPTPPGLTWAFMQSAPRQRPWRGSSMAWSDAHVAGRLAAGERNVSDDDRSFGDYSARGHSQSCLTVERQLGVYVPLPDRQSTGGIVSHGDQHRRFEAV